MKISIITVSYNSEKTIENTVKSVVEQTYSDIEYIIIDGASGDKTLEIAENYNQNITKIISEKDNGIYDAMNKGIINATGDYLLFLNSDDQLYDKNVIEKLAQTAKNRQTDVIYGDVCHYNPANGDINIQRHNKFNIIYLIKNTPAQPSTLYKKSVFNTVGNFSTDYKIVSDHEWFLRAFLKHKISSQYIDLAVNIFNTGGVSTNLEFEEKISKERQKMFGIYFNKVQFSFYSFVSKYLRSITTVPLIKRFFKV